MKLVELLLTGLVRIGACVDRACAGKGYIGGGCIDGGYTGGGCTDGGYMDGAHIDRT